MPESEINPFPELPVGSPGVASTQLQSSPGMTRGSFSSTTRPIMSPPPNNPSPAGSTPLVSPRPSPGRQARSNLPGLDTSSRENMNANSTPSRTDSFASGAWSTVATPGVADEEGREKRFDLSQGSGSPLPSAPPLEPKSPTGDRDRKNVRFAGPDGAPLSPAQTHITVDSYDTPDAPPPTTTSSSPTTPMPPANFQIPSSSSSSDPSSRARGDSTSSSSRQISNGTGNGTGNGFGTNFPSAPPPSLATAPSAPPVVPQPHGLGLSSPPPSAPTMPALTSAPPTRKQVEQTQKHARWAISALEFDDIETARSELRKALATIGG
jgi:vacuolar protein sorting-associated protein VTA1